MWKVKSTLIASVAFKASIVDCMPPYILTLVRSWDGYGYIFSSGGLASTRLWRGYPRHSVLIFPHQSEPTSVDWY